MEDLINNSGAGEVSSLEVRMFDLLEDGEWEKAEEYAERILDRKDVGDREKESEEPAKEIREKTAGRERQRIIKNAVSFLVVAAVILFAVWYITVGKKEITYRKALILLRQEKYDEAYDILDGLGMYKNAYTLIVSSICERANALIDAGDTKEAGYLIIPIKNSPEAQNVTDRINYELGRSALDKKDYESAYSYLEASNSYEDADILISESKYTRAEEAFNAGNYDEVYDLLDDITDYKDALSILKKAHYVGAETAVSEEDYGAALLNYHLAGDYEDSREKTATLLEDALSMGLYLPAYKVLQDTDPGRAAELLAEHDWLKLTQAQAGDIVTFGNYEQDNDKKNGQEPIEWVVLEKTEDSAWVITKDMIDCIQFDKDQESTTWKDSSIRAWLNGEFISLSLPEEMTGLIMETRNANHEFDNTSMTDDKVFLLTAEEYEQYGAIGGEHSATEFSKNHNPAGSDFNPDNNWTRSVKGGEGVYVYTDDNGESDSANAANSSGNGIRPSMKIRLSK